MEINKALFKNRIQIRKNIKTLRHYLEMNKTEFAKFTGIDEKRCVELETRLTATKEEIESIANAAEINRDFIIFNRISTELRVD